MFEKPSVADLREAAQKLGMTPSDAYLAAGDEISTPIVAAYATLDKTPDELPPVKYPRREFHLPTAAENPHGAWYVKTAIKGKAGGKLSGRRVALKDNICLAGVPMMIGADLFDGYAPEVDATVVERILDTGGAMTANGVDNALLLEVIAGPDGLDTRQRGIAASRYTDALAGNINGLRIAVVKEGFGHPNSEADVDARVREAAQRFAKLGAVVTDVSVPTHALGYPVWAAIGGDAACMLLLEMNGAGIGHEGLYVTSLIERAMGWRKRADQFADTLKIASIFSRYTVDRYGGRF